MKNRKGFTLIELLAVIVILGILLAVAIPNVAKYINSARKSTYISNVQSYAKAAKQESIALSSSYQLPVNTNDAIVTTFKALEKAIENGGKTSPYGGDWDENNSYVMIVNAGDADDPEYKYYITAVDRKGYAIGEAKNSTNVKALIKYEDLKEENVLQLGTSGYSYEQAATDNGFCVRYFYQTAPTSAADGLLASPVGDCN